jgi:uncharacterized protein (TIGR02646 family)
MIKVDCGPPSKSVAKLLRNRQARGTKWTSRHPQQGDREINETLQQAFHGKCGYCEGIEAETIDHFLPQIFHPDQVWNWQNYILCCDPCQRRKGKKEPVSALGHLIVNPREEEPLWYLRIEANSGKIVALPRSYESIERGSISISLLELDHRPDLDEQRRLMYQRVLDLVVQIVDPDSSPSRIEHAWQRLQEELHPRRPYLAIVQQFFTYPPAELEPLILELYRIIPDCYTFLASFRRPKPILMAE